jgi:hypothetical protein
MPTLTPARELEESPTTTLPDLPVVPGWENLVDEATRMCRLIDQHLDFEERGRRLLPGQRFMPIGLCPQQRVGMTTDLKALCG